MLAFQVHVNAGLTGVGLVNLVSFNSGMTTITISWSLAETSIGAVSRVQTLENVVKPEVSHEEIVQPDSWPAPGES